MPDTWTNWKRGLLKAWLALSLLWAIALTAWTVRGAMGNSGEIDGIGLLLGVLILYVLPLGAIPCILILLVGWAVVAIIDRLRQGLRIHTG